MPGESWELLQKRAACTESRHQARVSGAGALVSAAGHLRTAEPLQVLPRCKPRKPVWQGRSPKNAGRATNHCRLTGHHTVLRDRRGLPPITDFRTFLALETSFELPQRTTT